MMNALPAEPGIALNRWRPRLRSAVMSFWLVLLAARGVNPVPAAVQITGGNRDVPSTYVTVTGTLTSVGSIGLWYEVREDSPTGTLLDYGARKAESSWSITVRHLRLGTNVVVVRTKNASGVLESASVALNLVETVPPTVRPRPRPTEVWWGGLSDNSQLLDPAKPWNFVKQYQDGYFIHSAQNWGDLTSAERTQLATALKPYNTKFMIEVGGRSDATTDWPDLHTSRTRAGYWKTVATAEGNGIFFSEVTHDYHADDIVEFCRLNPGWPAGDQLAVYTGDYGAVTPGVPVPPPAIGWGEVFPLLLDRFPYAKVAQSYSPIYFKWQNYPALSTDNLVFNPLTTAGGTPILVNGQPVSFAFNMYDIHRMMLTSCTNGGQPQYGFATDCPWQATGNWSVQSRRLSNREKIRAYEAYLQGRGARHYRICNDNSVSGSGDTYDNEYKRDSLNVLYLHQNEGGRADKYIFESWYGVKDSDPYIGKPYTAAPESKPGSFSNLALDAIKYIKGIRTNGTLESLALIVTPVGDAYQIQLRNDGDIACLPTVQAIASGNSLISAVFTGYNGANATAAFTSAEGYVFARPIASNGENAIASKLLQPGETATVGALSWVIPPGADTGGVFHLALEAFWNPQDPTGVIRDRATLVIDPTPPPGIVAGTLHSTAADCSIKEDLQIEKLTEATVDLGSRGSSPYVERCTVYVFQLPDLGAVTNPFTAAGFTFNYLGKNTTLRDYDLYGLGRRADATVLPGDYYAMTVTPDPTDATRLQTGILTDSSQTGLISTSVGGSAGLIAYLNAQYAGGAGAGQYVFLRLNSAALKTGISYATLTMSEGGLAGPPATRPRIDYLVVENRAPTLAAISNQTLIAGQTLTFTNLVTDPDVPPQTLTFGLIEAPGGAMINASDGVFTWRPAIAQSPSTNPITVKVADNGSPSLSATQSFLATVLQPMAPALGAPVLINGRFEFTISGDSGPDYAVLASTNLTAWLPVWTNSSATPPFLFSDAAATNFPRRFYRVLLGP